MKKLLTLWIEIDAPDEQSIDQAREQIAAGIHTLLFVPATNIEVDSWDLEEVE